MAFFCVAFQIVIALSCRSFTLLKELAKSNCNIFAIASYFYHDSWKNNNLRESNQQKEAKNIKTNNFTTSNEEKSNIAIAILET